MKDHNSLLECMPSFFSYNVYLRDKSPVITKKSSTYTQGDYSGLSYGINIYIPECDSFEKKLLM